MPQTIVVGTDGSGLAERAVDEAAGIAKREGAQLHIVTAFPDPAVIRERVPSGAKTVSIDLHEIADGVLARAAAHAESKGIRAETHERETDPAEAIIGVAADVGADLIVVGSRGLTGIQRFLLGSVSNKVASHAHCSVLIVRD